MHTRAPFFLIALLLWYISFSLIMAIAPTDRATWMVVNILPLALVALLIATYRRFPFSHLSYLLITVYLTLHTIGAHYTYAKVPLGLWLEHVMDMDRNHFDRIVHFSFGLLMTYPTRELFVRLFDVRALLANYLTLITPLGLSGLWEIIESWFARAVRPELGQAALGSQGDIWDAQKDMAAAVYGSIVCLSLILLAQSIRQPAEIGDAETVEDTSLTDSDLASV
jgi:putative membrane protein